MKIGINVVMLFLAFGPVCGAEHVLVLQWPPTQCEVTKSCPEGSLSEAKKSIGFTIHGLWENPQIDPCVGQDFLMSIVRQQDGTLENELNWSWPSYYSPDSLPFWAKDWNNHGRCMVPAMGMAEYFRKTFNLYSSIYSSISMDLLTAGIEPGYEYEGYDFTAMMNSIRYRPLIVCVEIDNSFLLSELRYCVDDAVENIIDCPFRSSPHNSCPSSEVQMAFPPFKISM